MVTEPIAERLKEIKERAQRQDCTVPDCAKWYCADVPWLVEQLEKALAARPKQDEAGVRERARQLWPKWLRDFLSRSGAAQTQERVASEFATAFHLSELSSAEKEERQRAVEICDLTLDRMVDRDACARAIRDPETKYPSMRRSRG